MVYTRRTQTFNLEYSKIQKKKIKQNNVYRCIYSHTYTYISLEGMYNLGPWAFAEMEPSQKHHLAAIFTFF